MGEGERPDISQIIIGTIDDYDSIETPMTQMLSFVPKEKYDELEEKYNGLKKSHEELEKEKAFFKEKSNRLAYEKDRIRKIYEGTENEKDQLRNKVERYKKIIRTLAEELSE